MTAKRLLAIGHSYVLSVNRTVLRVLANTHGFDVTVVAPKFYQGDLRPLHLEKEPAGSPLHLVGISTFLICSPHLFFYQWWGLIRLLREKPFDVVGIWEEPYTFACWSIIRAVVIFGRGARICFYSCQNLQKSYPWPFSWFERHTVQRADGWQASGELVFSILSERGYEPSKGKVLALAVDTSLFKPSSSTLRSKTLDLLALSPPVIGFLGRLTQQKGIRVLLKALELLPRGLSWSALFVGSGAEKETIEEWASQHGWSDRVRVQLARHDEVPRYLGAMDLLAAPSQTTPNWKEQFGRMIIEAFACGVPVIGSDSGEIPNVVGAAGIVVPESDAPAWASEIASLLNDPQRRKELAELGRKRAECFSAEFLANQYAEFYRDILARGRQ